MAQSVGREVTIFFDQVIEALETNNIMATEANVFRMENPVSYDSQDVIWRPEMQIGRVESGLDLSSTTDRDILELNVPTTLNKIRSDIFDVTALELRDPRFRERRSQAAATKIAAEINKDMANLVALTGSLVVDRTAAPSGYADIAACEEVMDTLEIPIDKGRSMFLNSRDYNSMSADLAGRQTIDQRNAEPALRQSMIGNFAGFNTMRTNFQPTLGANAVSPTVSGDQFHVPVATQTVGGSTEIPVDNRGWQMTISDTTGVSAGDAFTIAGVFEVSGINKIQTDRLRTFRVVSIDSGTTMTVYPRLVPLDEIGSGLTQTQGTYANVNTQAADTAAITFLNTAAGRVNSFWRDGSVELVAGEIAWGPDDFPGATFMSETTDSGITLVLMKQGDIVTGVSTCRLTAFYDVVNLDPQQNGIMGLFQ